MQKKPEVIRQEGYELQKKKEGSDHLIKPTKKQLVMKRGGASPRQYHVRYTCTQEKEITKTWQQVLHPAGKILKVFTLYL